MPQTSDRDVIILNNLFMEGLIEDIPDRVRSLTGAVHIMCSDPFRCPESHKHVCSLIPKREGHPEPLIFPLYYPGGAMLLAPHSPVLPKGSTLDRDWLTAIRMAYEKFGITAVLGESHVACAMAYEQKLDAFRVSELTLSAKKRVEEEVKGVEFFPLVHTAGFRDRMKTYHAPINQWHAKTRAEERLVSRSLSLF